MKLSAALQRRLHWINLPGALLMILLQRMPALSLAIAADEMVVAAPLGTVLKAAVAAVAALGAVNTMVGATPLVPTSGTATGISVATGTPVSVFYTVNGTQTAIRSWTVTGSVPSGLDFSGLTAPGTVNGSPPFSLHLQGTPTAAGTFNLTLQAFDANSGGGFASSVYSYSITVTGAGVVGTAPAITTQPASQTITVGSSVTFTADASGSPAPTFQWRKGSTNISGATGSSFSIASVVTGDAGNYTVVATNTAGSATSNIATLTVSVAPPTPAAPAITTQPASQTVTTGSSVTFTAAASGTPAPTFQWRKGGTNISGATNASFSITSVTSADAGSYSVVATNSQGSATSNSATLTIGTAAAVQLANGRVTTGHGANFSAGNTSGAIQWQISTNSGTTWTNLANDGTYSGVTTAALAITNATAALNGALYRFVATSSGVVATSNAASLTVVQAFFPFPTAIVADTSGNLYIGDSNTNTIQKVNSSGQVSLLAGTSGTAGSGDGVGAAARFNQPAGITVLSGGVVMVADTANATIRRIASDGTVTTFAGAAGTRGSADGTGTAGTFSSPNGLAADASGNLFVADGMNDLIRKITSAGAVSTFAGAAGVTGTANGNGAAARFNVPTGLTVDGSGNVYVSDTTNNTIRKITSAGDVTTLAGLAGVSGAQDGTGGGAFFNRPGGLAVDGAGNLYVADTGNSTIRKITPAGTVTTLAGLAGIAGLMDGAGVDSFFNQPQTLSIDAGGNLYVADTGNASLRKITPAGIVTTLTLSAASTPAPTPTPPPASPTPSPSPAPSGGGGGGGGAPSLWFSAALLLLALGRRFSQSRR